MPAWRRGSGWRFRVTWVDETGSAEYLKLEEERGPLPAGTLIAKESFSVDDAGKVSRGQLFLMGKVTEGASPKTEDWCYMMVASNGRPQAVNLFAACSECHQGNSRHRDGMTYLVEDVRVMK